MLDTASMAAAARAAYGPEELEALAAYSDLCAALESCGLHPYIETRGGLAVCAYTADGSLIVVAGQDALPLRRQSLKGWHITHVPEDSPSPPWRCAVHDTVPQDPASEPPGSLALDKATEAVTAHLASCRAGAAA
ncbi:hypothetical protein [Streptomyces aureocirculatus]|uniref:hypothetical protein n=1 Tax=Streptomyces aureocirculatus TaxID=67275 RepID=UPI000A6BA1A3|nr:hypothetical protein [Streptomyces aureocirculatus]